MCPKNKCQFSLDKKILYWDSNHISHYGSKNLLAPQIMKFLEEEKSSIKILDLNNSLFVNYLQLTNILINFYS